MNAIRLLLLAPLLAACQKPVEVDLPRFTAELDRRTSQALQAPEVAQALDQLMNRLGEDPAVAKRGQELFAKIGDEPRLQQPFQAVIASLSTHPTFVKAFLRLSAQHPGATPEQVGALLEKQIGAVTDGPVFDKAVGDAVNRLFQRPELKKLLDQLGQKIERNPHLAALLEQTVQARVVDQKWMAQLTAKNGGRWPDRARATQLLLDSYFSQERLATWYVRVYSSPGVRRELGAGAARLLATPAFQRATTDLAVALFRDPQCQKRALDALVVLVTGDAGHDLDQRVQAIFELPVFTTASQAFVKALFDSPELAQLGDEILKAIVTAPDVRARFAELLTGSPG